MRFSLRRLRPFGFLLLAAVLAFAQQQASLHLLGHSIERIASQEGRGDAPSDAPEALCAKCLALAHLDHAVDAPVPAVVEILPPHYTVVDATIAHVDLALARPYESRAPPSNS